MMCGRDAKRLENFPWPRRGRPRDDEPEGDGPVVEPASNVLENLTQLFGRRGAIACWTNRRFVERVVHDGFAHRDVADARTVIDERMSRACGVPRRHVVGTFLE